MKKFILLLLSVLLCFSCVSCKATELPGHSDNFDREFVASFPEKYSLVDPQLTYFSASPWEVEFGDSTNRYLLSLIDDADPAQFVSVAEYTYFIGAPSLELGVYQSKDAPIPMKHWTISSISLLAGYLPFVPDDENDVPDEDFAAKPMEYNLSVSEDIRDFERKEWRELLNFVAESYENPIASTGRSFKSVYKHEEDGLPGQSRKEYTYYYLLVRFEENSNIVWLAKIYYEGGELYYSHGINKYEYCALGSDYSQMICDLIGFEPETETTDEEDETASQESDTIK